MGRFIDFEAVKRLASLRDVVAWLGLELKGNRCQCPRNEGDDRELVFTFDKGLWKCFGCGKRADPRERTGGDQIALVSHVLEVDQKQAAEHIAKKFQGYTPAQKGLPERGLDYLEHEHAAVQSLGMSAEKAVQLGIGYAPRGTMQKRILFPIRDTTGKLLGYLGISPGADVKLPKSLLQ